MLMVLRWTSGRMSMVTVVAPRLSRILVILLRAMAIRRLWRRVAVDRDHYHPVSLDGRLPIGKSCLL